MIHLHDINKTYFGAQPLHVLKGISLDIEEGEFVSIMGASGSGKSTLLNILGILDNYDSGEYTLAGTLIKDLSERRAAEYRNRLIGFIFQSFNLIGFKTAVENVELPLFYQGVGRRKRHQLAMDYLDRLGLAQWADHYPNEMSGGQKQRVAIARALVNRPKVLLLDEPLGALDLRLRKDMQNELKRIQQQMGITFIYVTHDQEEALTMSDTVVVMDKGRIQQIGTPEDIYNEPKNAFVADFIGESNILNGVMVRDKVVKMYGKEFPCVDVGFAENEPVDVVIRPEDIDIVPVEQGQLVGTVTNVTFKGMQYDIIVDFRGFKWLIQTTDHSPVGARIGVKIDPDGFHIMKKSEYSGLFGDYSSYSEEYEELADASVELEEEESEDED